MTALIDLTGQRFGKWFVLKRMQNSKQDKAMWLCRCDCGQEKTVLSSNLRGGYSKSCRSCQISYRNTTHGQTGTRLYNVWTGIIARCENPNGEFYYCYGGRGIKVCKEWRNDFSTFYKWAIANGYEKGLSIDRINNDGNYEPSNCRFVTMAIQSRNNRHNRPVKIGNETKPISEWAEQSGINYTTIWRRINKGCPEERLLEPVHRKKVKVS